MTMSTLEGGPPMGMTGEEIGDAQAEADRWNSKGEKQRRGRLNEV